MLRIAATFIMALAVAGDPRIESSAAGLNRFDALPGIPLAGTLVNKGKNKGRRDRMGRPE